MLYAALTPLLPHFERAYDLSKGGVGLLAAAYGIGTLAGALPGGIAAARLGARTAVLLGLGGVSAASVGVALTGNFATLFTARLVQGFSSSLTWAGALAWLALSTPRDRRGRTMGTAMAAGVFGALLGPVVGAAGSLIGVRASFATVAGVCALIAVVMATFEPSPPEPQPARAAVRDAQRARPARPRQARLLGGGDRWRLDRRDRRRVGDQPVARPRRRPPGAARARPLRALRLDRRRAGAGGDGVAVGPRSTGRLRRDRLRRLLRSRPDDALPRRRER